MGILISFIQIAAQVITLIVVADAVLSFFMSPYNPVRETLDRLVYPMLAPIRRILPTAGGLDFSPIILIILVQVIESILVRFLLTIG